LPDYPPEVYRKAAEAIERELMSGRDYGTHMDSDEALATAALDAVAGELGQFAASKIIAHMEEHGPGPDVKLPARMALARRMRRMHFETAARVAARAFLTEADLLKIAAEAISRGDFMICSGPEVPEAGDD